MPSLPPVILARYRIEGPAPLEPYQRVRDVIEDTFWWGRSLPSSPELTERLLSMTRIRHPALPRVIRFLPGREEVMVLLEPPPTDAVPLSERGKIRATAQNALIAMFVQLGWFFHRLGWEAPCPEPDRIFATGSGGYVVFGCETAGPAEAIRSGARGLDARYQPPEGPVSGEAAAVYRTGAFLRHLLTGRPRSDKGRARLGKAREPILAAMTDPIAEKRPTWSELIDRLDPIGPPPWGEEPIWIGDEDRETHDLLRHALADSRSGATAVALQVPPGRERMGRLLPFTLEAETSGHAVFHLWASAEVGHPYKLANDLIGLLEGVFRAINRPELGEEVEPLSDLAPAEQLAERWRPTIDRIVEVLVPDHCAGIVLMIEDIHHLDAPSLAALTRLVSWLVHVPCLLIVTGHPFSHPHFHELEQRLHLPWRFTHPEPLSRARLVHCLPTATGAAVETLTETRGEELLFFLMYAEQRGQGEALARFLRDCWSNLHPREQLVPRVLCRSARPLHGAEIAAAFQTGDLEEHLERLARIRFIQGGEGSGYRVAIPVIRTFCMAKTSSGDRRLIHERLLTHERGLASPDPIQLAFLSVMTEAPDREVVLDALEDACLRRFSLEWLKRSAALADRVRSGEFARFRPWFSLARGLPVPSSQSKTPALEHLARAARMRSAGKRDKAIDHYRRASGLKTGTPAVRAFALVRAAGLASDLGKRRELEGFLERFAALELGEVDEATRDQWSVQMAFAARSLGLTVADDPDPDLAEAQRAWGDKSYKRALAPLRAVTTRLATHTDLDFRGRIAKLQGNILFRNNLPAKAIAAYEAALGWFGETGYAEAVEAVRFNLAGAESLAGRFSVAVHRFEKILENAIAAEDARTTCEARYYLSECALMMNRRDRFEAHAARHRDQARSNGFLDERIRGLVLALETALSRDHDRVVGWLDELDTLMTEHEPDRLLCAEVGWVRRLARFVLGRAYEPSPDPYPETTRWRHRLLDVLTGREGPSWSELIDGMSDAYFGALECAVLMRIMEAGLVPEAARTRELADAITRRARLSGADYDASLGRCFAHLSGGDQIAWKAWERALGLLETIDWLKPRPGALAAEIHDHIAAIWPYLAHGVVAETESGWQAVDGMRGEPSPALLTGFLADESPNEPTRVTLTGEDGGGTRCFLLIPIGREEVARAFVWYEGKADARDRSPNRALLRYYRRFLMLARVQLAGAAARRGRIAAPGDDAHRLGIIGESGALKDAIARVYRYGPSDLNLFIWGESGTGKELFARAVHLVSGRAEQPFAAVNCSHYPENLVEDHLFGHRKGAFTGATEDRAGLLEQLDGGSLFLDEVGDLSEKVQSLLLRVLQEGELTRIGETTVRKVDIRLITATNKDLNALIRDGRFRGDLYFRMVEEEIRLPPLRERAEDLPLLLHHFASRYAPGRTLLFDRGFIDGLRGYGWPGNVRELESYVRKLLVHWPDVGVFGEEELLPFLRENEPEARVSEHDTLADLETAFRRRILTQRLARFDGNRTKTARSLGVSRQTLTTLIAKYSL